MNKIEAIKEALTFIRETWIGSGSIWEGSPTDFFAAVVYGDVVMGDVVDLIEAKNNGEPTPVEGVSGIIRNGKLVSVVVTK